MVSYVLWLECLYDYKIFVMCIIHINNKHIIVADQLDERVWGTKNSTRGKGAMGLRLRAKPRGLKSGKYYFNIP